MFTEHFRSGANPRPPSLVTVFELPQLSAFDIRPIRRCIACTVIYHIDPVWMMIIIGDILLLTFVDDALLWAFTRRSDLNDINAAFIAVCEVNLRPTTEDGVTPAS